MCATPPTRPPRNGCRTQRPSALDDACRHRQTARAMQHSALLNVMIAAARKAARALKRDFGELEKLQVSLKGPANFVSAADRRAEQTLHTELMKARQIGRASCRERGESAAEAGCSYRKQEEKQ